MNSGVKRITILLTQDIFTGIKVKHCLPVNINNSQRGLLFISFHSPLAPVPKWMYRSGVRAHSNLFCNVIWRCKTMADKLDVCLQHQMLLIGQILLWASDKPFCLPLICLQDKPEQIFLGYISSHINQCLAIQSHTSSTNKSVLEPDLQV